MSILNITNIKRWGNGGNDEIFIENEITHIECVDGHKFNMKIGSIDGNVQMYDLSAGDINRFYDASDSIIKSYNEAVNGTASICWYEFTNMKDWKESYIVGVDSKTLSILESSAPKQMIDEFKTWMNEGKEPSSMHVTRILVTN